MNTDTFSHLLPHQSAAEGMVKGRQLTKPSYVAEQHTWLDVLCKVLTFALSTVLFFWVCFWAYGFHAANTNHLLRITVMCVILLLSTIISLGITFFVIKTWASRLYSVTVSSVIIGCVYIFLVPRILMSSAVYWVIAFFALLFSILGCIKYLRTKYGLDLDAVFSGLPSDTTIDKTTVGFRSKIKLSGPDSFFLDV
jgi:hypothetical protein